MKAVIARSFAFIYSRNQPSLGLLGIVMDNDEFYAKAKEDANISIDLQKRMIEVGGEEFPFQLSDIEFQLMENKGVAASFRKYGKSLWKKMTDSESDASETEEHFKPVDKRMEW